MLRLKFVASVFLAAILFSCTNKPEGFVVKGKFEHAEGKMIYLNKIQSNLLLVDSVKATEDGSFSLEGKAETTELYLLQVGKKQRAMLYLVLGNQTEIELTGDADELMKTCEVKGDDKENKLMFEVSKRNYEAHMKLQELGKLFSSADPSAMANQDSLIAVYQNKFVSVLDEEAAFLKNFIDENEGALANVWAVYQQLGQEIILNPNQEIEYWDKVAKGLEKNYPNSNQTKDFTLLVSQIKGERDAQEKTKVGSIAPDFELEKADGTKMKLSDLRGQYVLLDFWASWCGPCRAENPNVVEAYKKYKDKNFTIYQVSLDKDKQSWLDAIKEDGLSAWYHASDLKYWQSAPAKLYGVKGIPSNFLLNPEGKIIAQNLRGPQLAKKLSEVLN